MQIAAEMNRHYATDHGNSIAFGDTKNYAATETTDIDMKSVKDRPPTPVVCPPRTLKG